MSQKLQQVEGVKLDWERKLDEEKMNHIRTQKGLEEQLNNLRKEYAQLSK